MENDTSTFGLNPSGAGGEPPVTGGPAGSGGASGARSDGSAGAPGGSAGTGGTSQAAGGALSSGGGGGVATGGAGVAGNGGAAGTTEGPDGGDDDAVSDAPTQDTPTQDVGVEADANCVRETVVAFCLRLGKNCGNTTAADNCGSSMTANCGTCGTLQMCGGGGQPNVCGTLTQGGTVTASNPGVAPEDMTKAFDGTSATKWFAGNGIKTGWIAYQFAGAASHTVTSYALTSANDVPGRDPSAWQLQGSNDGLTWTTVDTRTGQTFAARFQTNNYMFTNGTAYPRYRLNVTANSGGPDLQLAELQLFGQ